MGDEVVVEISDVVAAIEAGLPKQVFVRGELDLRTQGVSLSYEGIISLQKAPTDPGSRRIRINVGGADLFVTPEFYFANTKTLLSKTLLSGFYTARDDFKMQLEGNGELKITSRPYKLEAHQNKQHG